MVGATRGLPTSGGSAAAPTFRNEEVASATQQMDFLQHDILLHRVPAPFHTGAVSPVVGTAFLVVGSGLLVRRLLLRRRLLLALIFLFHSPD